MPKLKNFLSCPLAKKSDASRILAAVLGACFALSACSTGEDQVAEVEIISDQEQVASATSELPDDGEEVAESTPSSEVPPSSPETAVVACEDAPPSPEGKALTASDARVYIEGRDVSGETFDGDASVEFGSANMGGVEFQHSLLAYTKSQTDGSSSATVSYEIAGEGFKIFNATVGVEDGGSKGSKIRLELFGEKSDVPIFSGIYKAGDESEFINVGIAEVEVLRIVITDVTDPPSGCDARLVLGQAHLHT